MGQLPINEGTKILLFSAGANRDLTTIIIHIVSGAHSWCTKRHQKEFHYFIRANVEYWQNGCVLSTKEFCIFVGRIEHKMRYSRFCNAVSIFDWFAAGYLNR